MKPKFLILALCFALRTMTGWAGTEYVPVDSWYEEPHTIIETFVGYAAAETYYVHIFNGTDVDVTVELDAGWSSYFVTDDSTANIAIDVVNYSEWGDIALSGVPNGSYTVQISGGGWTTSYVYY